MRKRYSRSYTVLSFLTMFSYRELPSARPGFIAVIRRFFESKFRKKSIVLRYDILTKRLMRLALRQTHLYRFVNMAQWEGFEPSCRF